jgi:MFS family permease
MVTSFGQALAVRLAAGVFSGAALTVGQHLVLSGAGPHMRGRVSGMLQTVQFAGAALGPALGGVVMSLFGILPAFVAAASGSAVFLVWWVLRRGRLKQSPSEGVMPDAAWSDTVPPPGSLWSVRTVALYGIGFVIFSARFGGQQSLLPVVAYDLAGIEPWQFGLAMTAITLVSLVVAPWVGLAADRRGGRWPAVVAFAGGAALSALLAFVERPSWFLWLTVLAGVCLALPGGIPLAALAGRVAPQQFGVAMGIYRTCGDFGTILGPVAFGWLYDHGGSVTGMFGYSTVALVGAFIALFGIGGRSSAFDVGSEVQPVRPKVTGRDTGGDAIGAPDAVVFNQHRRSHLDGQHLSYPAVSSDRAGANR